MSEVYYLSSVRKQCPKSRLFEQCCWQPPKIQMFRQTFRNFNSFCPVFIYVELRAATYSLWWLIELSGSTLIFSGFDWNHSRSRNIHRNSVTGIEGFGIWVCEMKLVWWRLRDDSCVVTFAWWRLYGDVYVMTLVWWRLWDDTLKMSSFQKSSHLFTSASSPGNVASRHYKRNVAIKRNYILQRKYDKLYFRE